MWRKDRKGKKADGVMIMIKSTINVINVKYGKEKAELVSVQIMTVRNSKNSCINLKLDQR